MNYYFLLEDSKSLFSILPIWLEFMGFACTRVEKLKDVVKNNYIMESGQGVTQLETDAIFRTIETLQTQPHNIDKLIIIVDAEDIGCKCRKERILQSIHDKYSNNIPCEIKVFVCDRCFETWLLGCKGISTYHDVNISKRMMHHYSFYDIENNDPECMTKPTSFNKTVATYHFQYLHDLLLEIATQERQRSWSYRKDKAGCVAFREYFDAIVKRATETDDISSFKKFYEFITSESQ